MSAETKERLSGTVDMLYTLVKYRKLYILNVKFTLHAIVKWVWLYFLMKSKTLGLLLP